MSREALAAKVLAAVTTSFAYHDGDELIESDGPYMDWMDLDWVLIDGRCNLLAAVDALLAEFLVIPRSDIVGTDYAVEADDVQPPEYYSDRASAANVAARRGLRALERPVLPWSVIPLPAEAKP